MPMEALAELSALSAALGSDPEQVQAAGGNTSLKQDGVLWVKASGLWLADALARDVFVPVRLAPVLDAIEGGLADPVGSAVVHELNPEGLRPSIETTLHALLPHPVVVHTHSVRTIALAIRTDPMAELAPRLDGLAWAFVPYAHPGLPLTMAVAAELRERAVDVLVLGNHGLVVGGPDCAGAETLLREVERRLDAPVRSAGTPELAALEDSARDLGLRPVRHAQAHQLALAPESGRRATAGSLYPDHVIFLGPAAASLPGEAGREEVAAALGRGSRLLVVPGVGLFLPADAPASADELALCLALVLERVPPGPELNYLSADAEAALLDWDAEKYRQSLADRR